MQLLLEFLPIALFFVAYKFGDLFVATGVLIAAVILQAIVQWIRHRKISPMMLASAILVMVFGGLTLLLHDATFTNEELDAHRGWGHSTVEEATEFAMRCEAGTLLLTHHHPDRSDDEIDALVERCRAIVNRAESSLQVVAAADGMVLDIS